jgi:hypothetical protein
MTDLETQIRERLRAVPIDPDAMRRLSGLAAQLDSRPAAVRPRRTHRGLRPGWRRVAPVLAVAGAAIVVVAVVLAVAVLRPDADRSGGNPQPSPSASAGPQESQAPSASPSATRIATAAEQTLIDLLPRAGAISGQSVRPTSNDLALSLVYDDGSGASELTLDLSTAMSGLSCDPQPVPSYSCSVLPDGGRLTTQQLAQPPNGVAAWNSAGITRADGLTVTLLARDAPTVSGPPTRSAPPFTLDELAAIVSSPRWSSSMIADAAASTAPAVAPQAVEQTLIGLFPRSGAISELSGQQVGSSATVFLTYDDGQGAAHVDAEVTPAGSVPCASGQAGCTTGPDGTRLRLIQGPLYQSKPSGPVLWSLAGLRPDGIGVSITEWNAPDASQTASRPAPPFTVAELTAIVTSPAWAQAVRAAPTR